MLIYKSEEKLNTHQIVNIYYPMVEFSSRDECSVKLKIF